MILHIPYPKDAESIKILGQVYWTGEVDAKLLMYLAGNTTGSILEIGASSGHTTREFALQFPDRKIIAVDWLETREMHGQEAELPKAVAELASGLPNVVTHNCDSKEFTYPEGVGFVFIDADHAYESVLADSKKAFDYAETHPLVIAWHDYDPGHEPVRMALRELSADRSMFYCEGTNVVYTNA